MAMPKLPAHRKPAASPTAGPDLAGLMANSNFAAKANAKGVLPIDPNMPFFLRHHPRAWRLSTTFEGAQILLPDVTKHVLEPGVNGVRTRDKDEDVDMGWRNSVRDSLEKAWTYLDPEDAVPSFCLPGGVSGGGYIRDIDCKGPITRREGKRHVEAWDVPISTLPGDVQRFRFNTAKYELWLLWLVESGRIQGPNDAILPGLTDRVENHLDRVESSSMNPDRRKKVMSAKSAIYEAHKTARAASAPIDKDGRALSGAALEKHLDFFETGIAPKKAKATT